MLIGVTIALLVLIIAILQIVLYALNWIKEEKLKTMYRLVDKGNYQEALNLIKSSSPPLKRHSKIKYFYYCIKCYAQLGYDDEVDNLYKKILTFGTINDKWLSEIYEILGDIYSRKDDFHDAESYYLLGIEYNKRDPIIFAKLAQIYLHLKKPSKAIDILKAGLKHNPGSINAFVSLGEIQTDQKLFIDAETSFSDALRLENINPLANYGMARVLAAQNKSLSKALTYINLALKDKDIYYKALATKIVINFLLKDYPKVLEDASDYITAIVPSPESKKSEIETLYIIGQSYEKTFNSQKALKVFQSIERFFKNYKDVSFKISLYSKLFENENLLTFFSSQGEDFTRYCRAILLEKGYSELNLVYSEEDIRADFVTQEVTNIFVRSTHFYISIIKLPQATTLEVIDNILMNSKKFPKIEKTILFSISSPSMEVIDYARKKNMEIIPQSHFFETIQSALNKSFPSHSPSDH